MKHISAESVPSIAPRMCDCKEVSQPKGQRRLERLQNGPVLVEPLSEEVAECLSSRRQIFLRELLLASQFAPHLDEAPGMGGKGPG